MIFGQHIGRTGRYPPDSDGSDAEASDLTGRTQPYDLPGQP